MGALMSILSFKILYLIKLDPQIETTMWLVPFIIALNGIPLFDSLRVFVLRIMKGKSPFSADKSHMHHLYIKNGFGHYKGAFTIHSLHFFILILSLFVLRFLDITQGVCYVVFIVLIVFELNTYFRISNQLNHKEKLQEKKKSFVMKNRFLTTLKKENYENI